MDNFTYPVFIKEATYIRFDDGSNDVTVSVTLGVYYIDELFLAVESVVNSVIAGNTLSIEVTAGNRVLMTAGTDPFTLSKPSGNLRTKGHAMLGLTAHTGGNLYFINNGESSFYAPLGVWAPGIEPSDTRVETARQAFMVPRLYVNAWETVDTRQFKYKALHPTKVLYSPFRAPADLGSDEVDTNNTFQSLFESVQDGDTIYWGAESLELVASDSLRTHLTPFGVPERYTVAFKAVQNG